MPSTTSKPDWRVWQDAAVARSFTDVRRGGVYGAPEQFDTMLRLLEQARTGHAGAPRVLDLGCGDGVLLEAIFDAYPAAHGVGVDGSPPMLERAAERFEGTDGRRVRFISTDLSRPEWREPLAGESFDAVVSGFAIHHLEDEQKLALYGQVFRLLKPGGVFVNIEHAASASPLGEALFQEAFARHLAHFLRTNGGKPEATFESVLDEMRSAPDRDANRLSPVETQLDWLRGIGFVDVDCYWKWYELAVLSGFRPA